MSSGSTTLRLLNLVQRRSDIWQFFSTAHKRKLAVVAVIACAVSALETLVAGAVIPYVGCLSDRCPDTIEQLVSSLGKPLIPTLSLALFGLIVIKLGMQALYTAASARFNQQVQRDTITRLLQGYLHLDWQSFRKEARSHYLRRCVTTANDASAVSVHCLNLAATSLTLLFLAVLMVWQYPYASLPLGAGFLLLNVILLRTLGKKQRAASRQREHALGHWNSAMAEAFAAFREIRIYRLESFFLSRFESEVQSLSSANIRLALLPTLPRLILDFAVLGTLLLIVSAYVWLDRPIQALLPQLVFYAVVARTLLPAMIIFLGSRAALAGAVVNVRLVLDEWDRTTAHYVPRVGIVPSKGSKPGFHLEGVTYSPQPDLPPVIQNYTLRIAHPSWAAIVGPSGAGKSTLMELLCGVIQPQAGQVRHYWPDASTENAGPLIAYLPQHVVLLDATVFENVVFGFDSGDGQRVEEALSLACLLDVVNALPDGVHAHIGADGARLSGGQRQRLALARALYRNPDLLLLDEATSGLDEPTESNLLRILREQRPALSVIYITHRSSSLRFADSVIELGERRVETTAG